MAGGSDGAYYFAPKKIHTCRPYIVHPKKYKTGNFSNHAFGSCGKFGLNCVRTISLAEIRTPKKYAQIFQTQKSTRLNSSTQKHTGVENFRPKKIHRTPPSRFKQKKKQTNFI